MGCTLLHHHVCLLAAVVSKDGLKVLVLELFLLIID